MKLIMDQLLRHRQTKGAETDRQDPYDDLNLFSTLPRICSGDDVTLLEKRKRLYEEAKKKHPEHWPGETQNWSHELTAKPNPCNAQPKTRMEK